MFDYLGETFYLPSQSIPFDPDYSTFTSWRIAMDRSRLFVLLCASFLISLGHLKAQVTEVWTSSYNGPANNADNAYVMAIDALGNVYVAGESRTGASTTDSIDYAVVKYDPNGDTLWVRFYNGTGNRRDVVRAIAVDDSGNVYVTGDSYGTTDYDMATVKYNSSGSQLWAMRYNGSANGAEGASAIAVDESGNVYVTGYSDGDASPVLRQDDYVTIKYNAAGAVQWVRRYNGPSNFHDVPHDIALDTAGYVYITGQSSGSGGTRYNYTTIKYNSVGDSVWLRAYNNDVANYNDIAWALQVDGAGNVYVTGSSDATSSGTEDYVTIKYDASGTQQWLARYNGPGGGDEAYAMAIDGNGSVYVTGRSRGGSPTFSYDYLTIRYDASTGDTIWTARYDGDGNGLDAALSIALDYRGNAFVTGYSTGTSTGLDMATIGYDSTGARRWVRRYASSGSNNDLGNAIAADTAGFVYVAGTGYGGTQLNNFVTMKYYDTGTVAVEEDKGTTPSEFSLAQNYPNPFNPSTTISFQIPRESHVTMKIFDLIGREITTLVDETKPVGTYRVSWNSGNQSSGIYFYRLTAGSFVSVKKLVLLR